MVWRKAASFDRGRASAATWIYTIARNKRIDLLRRSRPAGDRHRGLAGGFCPRRRRCRQIRPGRTDVYEGEGTFGRPVGRSAGGDPEGVFRGQDAYRHRRGIEAAAGYREVPHSPGPRAAAGSVGERRVMSRHTAPEELLLDYAAGALPQGPALAVALHVALDPAARRTVERLDAVGGALIEGETEAALDDAALRAHAGAAGQDRRRAAAGAAPAGRGPASNGRRRRWPAISAPMRAGGASFGGFEEIRLTPAGRQPSRVAAAARARPRPADASPCRQRIHGRAAGRLHRRDRQLRRRRFRRRPRARAARADRRSRSTLHRADRGREADRADRPVRPLA